MQQTTTKRTNIAALIFPMTAAVAFGFLVTLVLAVPALNTQAGWLIPASIVLSILAGALAAWIIAPRMRLGYPRDSISG
ncbi:MAG: hypothetical protein AB7F96_15030 [Beijerinckiaceae bacterium]